MKEIIYLALLLSLTASQTTQTIPSKVYQLNQFTMFKGPQLRDILGCTNGGQFSLGTFLYGVGSIDALSIAGPSTSVGISLSCLSKKNYALVFGRSEDYRSLIRQNAGSIIQTLRTLDRFNIVINWQFKPETLTAEEVVRSKVLLKEVINAQNPKPIVRIPASLLCYKLIGRDEVYATGLAPAAFIVEMYGKNSSYNSYQDFFTRKEYQDGTGGYTSMCPISPSLEKMKGIVPGIELYSAMTLRQHIEGYTWNFQELVKRANNEGMNITKIFYDDFPPNMLRL